MTGGGKLRVVDLFCGGGGLSRGLMDAGLDVVAAFASVVCRVRPRFFIMENVERAQKSRAFGKATEMFKSVGYGLTESVLDASLCGAPQYRKRVIVFGIDGGRHNALVPVIQARQAKRPMTLRDYLGGSLGVEFYYRHPRSYARRGVFGIDEPSPTVRGVNRPVPKGYPGHPGDPVPVCGVRPLTTKERSLIQTFPAEWDMSGPKADVEQIVGNAVPVKLAEFVGGCLLEYVRHSSKYETGMFDHEGHPVLFEQRPTYPGQTVPCSPLLPGRVRSGLQPARGLARAGGPPPGRRRLRRRSLRPSPLSCGCGRGLVGGGRGWLAPPTLLKVAEDLADEVRIFAEVSFSLAHHLFWPHTPVCFGALGAIYHLQEDEMGVKAGFEKGRSAFWRGVALAAVFALSAGVASAATSVWCPHVTAYGGWKTEISVYASGGTPAQYRVEKFDGSGNWVGALEGAAVKGWTTVPPASLAYEGSARVTSERDLLVKASYQLGDSPNVCEFFLTGASGLAWVLPNSARSWMSYSGLALVNSGDGPASVVLEAWKNGVKAAPDAAVNLGGRCKYVKLAGEVWPGLALDGLDTIVVRGSTALPAPLLITGNAAGDRNLFFLAQPEPAAAVGGDLVETDSIVGNLRYVPAGTFIQGSPSAEVGHYPDEAQFTHTLTKGLAVMETEVTQQMWSDLKEVQPTLPPDPSNTAYGTGRSYPVQQASWYEALLFANLLSDHQGRTPCYYADAGFTTPIDATNYKAGTFFCNWAVDGYRLPSEGEWEYFCRAGTSSNWPFSISEPNYNASTWSTCSPSPALAALDSAAWWCGNSGSQTHPAGGKVANPWNLKDVHGNVWEWCWDWYSPAYPAGAATDYRGPNTGSTRVFRGGSRGNSAGICRSALRYDGSPDGGGDLGFRLARGQ